MGNNYHLNQTQMKVKMSAKGMYATCKSTSISIYMTCICSQQALRETPAE